MQKVAAKRKHQNFQTHKQMARYPQTNQRLCEKKSPRANLLDFFVNICETHTLEDCI